MRFDSAATTSTRGIVLAALPFDERAPRKQSALPYPSCGYASRHNDPVHCLITAAVCYLATSNIPIASGHANKPPLYYSHCSVNLPRVATKTNFTAELTTIIYIIVIEYCTCTHMQAQWRVQWGGFGGFLLTVHVYRTS